MSEDTEIAEIGALIPDPEVFADLRITPMTGWRWDRDPRMVELGWPPPIYRGRYKFRDSNLYRKFKANGGNGFYAEPLPPYKEPGLMDDDVSCPVAEKAQKQLMLMKTNYRDLGEAERQAEIFWKTVNGN